MNFSVLYFNVLKTGFQTRSFIYKKKIKRLIRKINTKKEICAGTERALAVPAAAQTLCIKLHINLVLLHTGSCSSNSGTGFHMCDLARPCRARRAASDGGLCSARRWLSENRYLSKPLLPPRLSNPPHPWPCVPKSQPRLVLGLICYYLT